MIRRTFIVILLVAVLSIEAFSAAAVGATPVINFLSVALSPGTPGAGCGPVFTAGTIYCFNGSVTMSSECPSISATSMFFGGVGVPVTVTGGTAYVAMGAAVVGPLQPITWMQKSGSEVDFWVSAPTNVTATTNLIVTLICG
jgi:hypothetical protein